MAPGKAIVEPPKGTKHKQCRSNKKKGILLRKKMDTLTVEDSSPDDNVADGTASQTAGEGPAAEEDPDTTSPATIISMLRCPLYEEWEKLEDAEAEEVKQRQSVTDSKNGWIPGLLPVMVHVASPQTGQFTRSVESDIQYVNSIEAVKNLVSSSMGWELRRANIDISQGQFAGLMVYGPTTKFDQATIEEHTRGLFLHEGVFKKWWLSVCKTAREPGDMVKIAFVLWDANEAAARRDMLQDLQTNGIAQVLGNHLEKLELKLLDIDVEKGCRSYMKIELQLQNARIETIQVKKERAELQISEGKLTASKTRLTKTGNKLANAIKAGNMEEATRLVDEWKQATCTKGGLNDDQSIADVEEDDDGEFEVPDVQESADEDPCDEGDEDDSVEDEDIDDPDDANYVA